MKHFICSACGVKLYPITIWLKYEKEEGTITCPKCNVRARLRHFTKGVTYNQIDMHIIKWTIIWSVVSIPFQVLVYLKILNWIFGG